MVNNRGTGPAGCLKLAERAVVVGRDQAELHAGGRAADVSDETARAAHTR